MENGGKETEYKSSARQTGILVGVALMLLSAIFVYIAVSQPKIDDSKQSSETPYTSDYEVKESGESKENTSYTVKATEKTAANSVQSPNSVQYTQSVRYPLDLNTCTAQELMTIDGVGGTRAAAIISYREHIGGYKSVEQLKDISGIGDKTYEKISPYVTVK